MRKSKKQENTDYNKEISEEDGYNDFSESVEYGNREETIVNTNPPPRTPPKGRDTDNSED